MIKPGDKVKLPNSPYEPGQVQEVYEMKGCGTWVSVLTKTKGAHPDTKLSPVQFPLRRLEQ